MYVLNRGMQLKRQKFKFGDIGGEGGDIIYTLLYIKCFNHRGARLWLGGPMPSPPNETLHVVFILGGCSLHKAGLSLA